MSSLAQLGSWSLGVMPCSEGPKGQPCTKWVNPSFPGEVTLFASLILLEPSCQRCHNHLAPIKATKRGHEPATQLSVAISRDRQNLGRGLAQRVTFSVVGRRSRLRTLPITPHPWYVKRRADFKFWSRKVKVSGHEGSM